MDSSDLACTVLYNFKFHLLKNQIHTMRSGELSEHFPKGRFFKRFKAKWSRSENFKVGEERSSPAFELYLITFLGAWTSKHLTDYTKVF